jgi:O-antigen/teichoic acid export membrane protein
MLEKIKIVLHRFLVWTQKYTKTDMVYLAKGGSWLLVGQFFASSSALILSVIFANYLPKETYGTYKFVLSICSILAIPTLSGMNLAVSQSVAQNKDGIFTKALRARLTWGILGGLGSVLLSAYYLYNNQIELAIAFLVVAVFIPLSDSFSLYDSFLGGKKDFKTSTRYNIISQIIATVVLLLTVLLTKNLYLLLLAYFVSWTILRVVFLKLTLKKYKLNDIDDPQSFSYGKHLSLMGIIGMIASQIDKILIYHYIGPTELAIYSFAIAIPEQIRGVYKISYGLAIPKLSQHNDYSNLKSSLVEKTKTLTFISIIIVALYLVASPLIYKIFFPKYLASIPYSQLFIFGLLIIPSIDLTGLYFNITKDVKTLYKINNYSNILGIIYSLVFISLFGVLGAIIKTLVYWASNALINSYYFSRKKIAP